MQARADLVSLECGVAKAVDVGLQSTLNPARPQHRTHVQVPQPGIPLGRVDPQRVLLHVILWSVCVCVCEGVFVCRCVGVRV